MTFRPGARWQIGLAGELRQVPEVERRIAEAARYGFTTAVVRDCAARGAPSRSPFLLQNQDELAHVLPPLTCLRGIPSLLPASGA